MRIRTGGVRRARWLNSRSHAFAVLGLTGSGALTTIYVHGIIRIRRGGAWLYVRGPRRRNAPATLPHSSDE